MSVSGRRSPGAPAGPSAPERRRSRTAATFRSQVNESRTRRRASCPSAARSASGISTARRMAATRASTSPGSTRSAASAFARRAGGRGGLARPPAFQHPADLVEVGGHDRLAHGHVLEELRRAAEEGRAVGVRDVRREQDVGGGEGARGLGLGPDPGQRDEGAAQAFPQDRAHAGSERAVAHVEEMDPAALEPRPILVDQPADGGREDVGAVPGAKGPDEGEEVRVRGNAELRAGPPPVLGREAERIEDVRVDAVGVEEDPLARRAQLHRLLDEGLRDHHHQLGVSQAGALDPLRQRLEAQPLAPVTLGPDLRAVELEDERHLQALAQQRPGHVVEGEALVDEVGRETPCLLTSGAQEDTLVAVRVHLEGEGDEEAGKDDPLGARRRNERLLVGAHETHGNARAGEGVRDPRHVGDRAADTRAEAQGGLEVEAPVRGPDSLGDEGPGDEAPGAPPGGRDERRLRPRGRWRPGTRTCARCLAPSGEAGSPATCRSRRAPGTRKASTTR